MEMQLPDRQPLVERPDMPKGYGIASPQAGRMLEWAWVLDQLEKSHNYWISSNGTDGRPHSMPVWGVRLDNSVYFSTDRASRKARNLAADARVNLHLESGDEVVIIEGLAEEVSDRDTLSRMANAYNHKYLGMNYDADGLSSQFTVTYSVRPLRVLAWLEKDFPNTATRWRFDQGT